MAEKVVLGLSGGVDSAVAAAQLRRQGYEVHGLFLEVGLGGEQAAQRAAEELEIPLHLAHRRADFEREVCAYFAETFRQAGTPNPCVVCNPLIKFRALTDYADEIGAAYIATGHYARTGRDADGRALLLRAHAEKDQSYMLHRLPRETVARCLFPLGGCTGKDEVRADARSLGLTAPDKPDSMDICFIPDGDVSGWLERHGQRKGLGVAAEGRLFVHALRPETNEVVLSLSDVYRSEITVCAMHYIAPEYAANGPFCCEVRVRYSRRSDRATVYPTENGARIVFESAVRAPAKGQSAVLYDGDIVIGGGFIESEQ